MESIGILWQALSEVTTILNAKLVELASVVGGGVQQVVDILAK